MGFCGGNPDRAFSESTIRLELHERFPEGPLVARVDTSATFSFTRSNLVSWSKVGQRYNPDNGRRVA
jgi:hypothetical protein